MFKKRRDELINNIKDYHKHDGYIVLIANFENECCTFRQESSFFYYTGITEPASIVVISPEGYTTLYVPRFQESRNKWLGSSIDSLELKMDGIDSIDYLGDSIKGYHLSVVHDLSAYKKFSNFLKTKIKKGKRIYSLISPDINGSSHQKILLWRLFQEVLGLKENLTDVSSIVAAMRRRKSIDEIKNIKKAVEITSSAHRAAEKAIYEYDRESYVHGALETVMRNAGATTAFPSIVAGGKNSCILHYTKNSCSLSSGDIVVVDIGAQIDGYCADITRTYSVSGTLSERQKEIYNLVLETQRYIEHCAKPGMWLSNKQQPEKSLHHLAVKFLKDHGYDKRFTHGIGHFLGLDVHDVGDYQQPLAENDVFTIEPGIYIPEESLGIRIEDDYLMTKDGVECLSDGLPKNLDEYIT